MTYQDYFHLAATEIESSQPTAARRSEHLLEVRKMAVEGGAEGARFDQLLRAPIRARLDAMPSRGLFPLIFYAPGSGGPAFQNTVLCEYLASHGFVVIASPSVGPDSRQMPATVAGIEAQVADIQLALETAGRTGHADPPGIGLVGYSWGGMAVLLKAMRDRQVDAVAALDPTVMVKKGHLLATKVPGYSTDSLRVPTMLMIAAAREWPERDVSFFEEVSHTDVSLLRFGDFLHGDFASIVVQFFVSTTPNYGGRDLRRISIGYATMCRYLLAFFSANLRSDRASQRFLTADPTDVGIAEGLMTIERHTQHEPEVQADRR